MLLIPPLVENQTADDESDNNGIISHNDRSRQVVSDRVSDSNPDRSAAACIPTCIAGLIIFV